MALFFKATNRLHPKHHLPTVLWKGERSVFEFVRGSSGFLECETQDPTAIALLREMGYDEEPTHNMSAAPPTVKAISTRGKAPTPPPGR